VFPFSTNAAFSLDQMEHDLRAALALGGDVPVKDICFSGNGEPSLSPDFPEAFKLAEDIRGECVPSAKLVLITNGAGLLQPQLFSLLRDAAGSPALDIWLKLDAGTPWWYQKINRTEIPHEKIIAKITEFAACAQVTIQTMLCAVDGKGPPPEEAQAWENLICKLATGTGSVIRKVHIYGKARSALEDPKAEALPIEYLEDRAASLRSAFTAINARTGIPMPPVEVYP
jgi:histidinol dehydrogenase